MEQTAKFRYIMCDTRGFGSCDECNQEGPVGHLCLPCCRKEGMKIGKCYVCPHEGPVWEACDWCNDGQFVPKVHGQCECGQFGPVGLVCYNCGDHKYKLVTGEDE
jgi:hypothetical protein